MSVKEILLKKLPDFPDDITWAEVKYRLYLLEMIEESDRQFENGEYYTQKEIEEKYAKWLK